MPAIHSPLPFSGGYLNQYNYPPMSNEFMDEHTFVKALFDFKSSGSSGLSFHEGDIIQIYTKSESGWWDGVCDGQRGWLPSNYVMALTDEETNREILRVERAGLVASRQELSDLSVRKVESRDAERERQDKHEADDVNDLWVPRISSGGQVYYFNTKTFATRQDLPSADPSSDVDAGDAEGDDHLVTSTVNGRHRSSGSSAGSSPFSPAQPKARQFSESPKQSSYRAFNFNAPLGTSLSTTDRLEDTLLPSPVLSIESSPVLSDPGVFPSSISLGPSPYSSKNVIPRTTSSGNLSRWDSLGKRFTRESFVLRRKASSGSSKSSRAQAISDVALKIRDTIKSFKDSIDSFSESMLFADRIGHAGSAVKEAHSAVGFQLNLITTAIRDLVYISGVFSVGSSSSTSSSSTDLSKNTEAIQRSYLKVQYAFSRLLLSTQTYLRILECVGVTSLADQISSSKVKTDAEDVERLVVAFGLQAELTRNMLEKTDDYEANIRRGNAWVESVGLDRLPGGQNGFLSDARSSGTLRPFATEATDPVTHQVQQACQQAFGRLVEMSPLSVSLKDGQEIVMDVLTRVNIVLRHVRSFDIANAIDLDGEDPATPGVKDSAYGALVQDANIHLLQFERSTNSLTNAYGQALAYFGALPIAELSSHLSVLQQLANLSLNAFQSLCEVAFFQVQAVKGGIAGRIGNQQRSRTSRILSSGNQSQVGGSSSLSRSSSLSQLGEAALNPTPRNDSKAVSVDSEDDNRAQSTPVAALGFGRKGDRLNDTDEDRDVVVSIPTSASSLSLSGRARTGSISALSFVSSVPSVPSTPSTPLEDTDGRESWLISKSEQFDPSRLRQNSSDTSNSDIHFSVPRTKRIAIALSPAESGQEDTPWYLGCDWDPEDVVLGDGDKDLVKGATLDALIVKLTSHLGDKHSHEYRETFLMTYKSFTSPSTLMEKLAARFYISPPDSLTVEELGRWRNEKQRLIWLKVINVLKCWVTESFIDADEHATIRMIEAFVDGLPDTVKVRESGGLVRILQNRRIDNAYGGLNSRKATVVKNDSTPAPILPKHKIIRVTDMDPLEVARQLTILDAQLFGKIRPVELLMKAWSDMSDSKKAPNVKACIRFSNNVSKWVQVSLLSEYLPKYRAQIMKAFIQIANCCLSINNFSCMASIIAGLVSSPISRLKRTIELLSSKTIATRDALIKLVDSERNFGAYKERLAKSNGPAVPFLGVYLTYLTFIEDGNQNFLPGNKKLINFSKRTMTACIMKEIQSFQLGRYNFALAPPIQAYLHEHLAADHHVRSDQQLYERSKALEPREQEMERLTRLFQESGFL
ncbi:Ras1 guanine nucleotide exchange factor [Phaffia rhodozyma]|uniref:Ras1 guanine nucleotide exchange factor n=1 Tax=Phaffia rhodozyma TaxID=264483 RepID=A0A0F7SEY1_PHARH|nr:Ras1 guanine nucleotide exchange factor [Phaffia rhodozyma]